MDGIFDRALPNLFHAKISHPADLYTALNRAAPIRSLQSLVPEAQFLHEVGNVDIGKVGVLSQTGSDTAFYVEHTSDLHLVVMYGGSLVVKTAGGTVQLRKNEAALLPPGYRQSSGRHSLVAITLPPAAVEGAAAAISGRAGEEPTDLLRYRERQGRKTFDELIDFIRANLDQPLRLSDLEARSQFSRWALQEAFRQRLNTTPMEWIREQRLQRAMEHLQRAEERVPLKELALRCGYLRLSHFSRDFKKRFGLPPSRVDRL